VPENLITATNRARGVTGSGADEHANSTSFDIAAQDQLTLVPGQMRGNSISIAHGGNLLLNPRSSSLAAPQNNQMRDSVSVAGDPLSDSVVDTEFSEMNMTRGGGANGVLGGRGGSKRPSGSVGRGQDRVPRAPAEWIRR